MQGALQANAEAELAAAAKREAEKGQAENKRLEEASREDMIGLISEARSVMRGGR